ncbi:trimeric intracellular cation channel family protein [Halospeciosus flavus]|uniref:Trimeric intracellular cation channel family protein n=1 Tax=Halospeciosus flavus TaxID=3032283 RepID=A0ABD5Z5P8_9EURY|nr:trimeric intracellular cation channel family protein [Halospeciosus flavus]
MSPIPVFDVMNAVGLVAFAVVGSLKASDARLDLLGVSVLGFLTALGGGITRDVLVGRIPAALSGSNDVTWAALGVVLAMVLARIIEERHLLDHPALLVSDAVGLAAFAATGALVGVDAGVSAFGVVVLAALTGVGGGTISDVLLDRIPFVLTEDFYATCAVAGGVVFVTATAAGVDPRTAAVACAAVVFGTRVAALRRGWELPRL